MDKILEELCNTDDIIYLNMKVNNYIKEQSSNIDKVENEINNIVLECYNSLDIYGLDKEHKEFIENKIKDIYISNNEKLKKLTYKEFTNNIEKIKELSSQLCFIEYSQLTYNSLVESIIEKYKIAIQKPIKNTFLGKKKHTINIELKNIKKEFINTLTKIFPSDILINIFKDNIKDKNLKKTKTDTVKSYLCIYCKKSLKKENDLLICDSCGYTEKNTTLNECTYEDLGRINLNQKYTYEKRCHFRDTINQFQGKQNKYIPETVITELLYAIKKHGININKLNKEHIRSFLTEIGYTKFYEDVQLIYSKITKKPCPSISHLEKELYADFDKLVTTFLSFKDLSRKSFLNSHYVLRQLLIKHGYNVADDDLNSLKTPARLREHDDIYQRCCNILNWNFKPQC
jgi:hypothetical protein